MAQAINFDDALDYIFIANDSGSSSYLISNDVAANVSRMTSTISATAVATAATTAAAAVIMSAGSGGIRTGGGGGVVSAIGDSVGELDETTMLTTLMGSTTVGGMTDVDTMTSISAAALVAENLYNGVAVDLGSMLINETLLMDFNDTGLVGSGLFGDSINGSDLLGNSTSNVTATDDDLGELLKMAATSVILGLMILITIIGNVFVIAAIILERNLQNVANYLVASLAVADLFVACLVMPLGAVYEISQGWILGPELCDIWTSCDVLCCTASILHLLAIAADRYWAVTNIDYIHSRTSNRVFLMIFCVWFAAVIVSLAPQFGWKDPDYLQRIEQQKCMVSQDVSYQVFATCCTFYVPLLVILVLYWKIYQTARKRIHRRRPKPIDVTANNNQPDLSAQKKRKRLRLRLGKFTPHEKSNTLSATTGTTLGLVEGNSTNTVNTVEDTEFSSSNVDSKSRAGIEVTTNFSNPEEVPTTSSNQITTVSHLVALANQQHSASTKSQQQNNHHHHPQQQQEQQKDIHANNKTSTATRTPTEQQSTATTTTIKSIVHNSNSNNSTTNTNTNRVSIALPITEINGANTTQTTATSADSIDIAATTNNINLNNPTVNSNGIANGNGNGNGVEVLEDPQLQQQLQQVQQQQQEPIGVPRSQTVGGVSGVVGGGGGGGASTSNATTITSISALSPQTPTTMTPASTGPGSVVISGTNIGTGSAVAPLTHPLSAGSANPSNQVTPVPKPKYYPQISSVPNPVHKVTKRKETLEAKRERKAAKTLAIITGAFVVCWLPFFVMALMMPLCESCMISDSIASLFLWLGYFNSTLNPVIYTIFSPEFRQAFKRILFGGHRPVHYRSGKI